MKTKRIHDNDYTLRTIQLCDHGIRRVTKEWHGECWYQYLIVPRSVVVDRIRKLRASGCSYHDIERWQYAPRDLIQATHYGGPGCSYVYGSVVSRINRRYVVFVSNGGLDV